jgi:hypothetical protein
VGQFLPATVVGAADGLAAGRAPPQAFVLSKVIVEAGIGMEGPSALRAFVIWPIEFVIVAKHIC